MHARIINLVAGISNKMTIPILDVIKLIKTNFGPKECRVKIEIFEGTFYECVI